MLFRLKVINTLLFWKSELMRFDVFEWESRFSTAFFAAGGSGR
jgi:hypothetical protein